MNQSVEIVLTAHPTEVNRRTMLQKHQHVREFLEQGDRDDLTLYERRELQAGLRREIATIWESDELKR
jgi:phosphoenolpyruvate carboxylase